MAKPIRILAALEETALISEVLPAVEAAGMFDTQPLEHVKVIIGKVASKRVIPIIEEIPGILVVEKERGVQAVD